MSSSQAPPSLGSRLATAVVAFVVAVALLEPGFRVARWLAGHDRRQIAAARAFFLGELAGLFEARPFINFYAFPGLDPLRREGGFKSTVDIPVSRTRPTIRIAFIGGSTTAGPRSRHLGSYPNLIEERLQRAGLPVEVMNCGGVGWSSAENLVHYALSIQDYAPDWVVIHQGGNDVPARLYRDFRPDYGHYRRPAAAPRASRLDRILTRWSDLYVWLLQRERTIPPDLDAAVNEPLPPADERRLNPVGIATFRRNTRNLIALATARGARVLLTTESHNRHPRGTEEPRHALRQGMDEASASVRDLARELELPFADTEAALETHPEVFTDYVHVTPEGDRLKARVILRELVRAGLGRPHP